ncbi:MAG: PP2C family protein-serine/threonine phosphatase [Actinomycetota bacterium]
MSQYFQSVALSDVGLHRTENEDSGWAGAKVLAVADGLGGHAGGEIASSLAIKKISQLEKLSLNQRNAETTLVETFLEINNSLAIEMKNKNELQGMGTTLTAIIIGKERLFLAHLGDSRAYLIRDGKISQLTKDHTVVQELLDQGRISPEEIDGHPQRSFVTKALMGAVQHERPDFTELEIVEGDCLLLCSDGLAGVVDEAKIRKVIDSHGASEATLSELKGLAFKKGAPDNVTIIVASVSSEKNVHPGFIGAARGESGEK